MLYYSHKVTYINTGEKVRDYRQSRSGYGWSSTVITLFGIAPLYAARVHNSFPD